jgi:hypothetical protein
MPQRLPRSSGEGRDIGQDQPAGRGRRSIPGPSLPLLSAGPSLALGRVAPEITGMGAWVKSLEPDTIKYPDNTAELISIQPVGSFG